VVITLSNRSILKRLLKDKPNTIVIASSVCTGYDALFYAILQHIIAAV
jgi:hypothetical protein